MVGKEVNIYANLFLPPYLFTTMMTKAKDTGKRLGCQELPGDAETNNVNGDAGRDRNRSAFMSNNNQDFNNVLAHSNKKSEKTGKQKKPSKSELLEIAMEKERAKLAKKKEGMTCTLTDCFGFGKLAYGEEPQLIELGFDLIPDFKLFENFCRKDVLQTDGAARDGKVYTFIWNKELLIKDQKAYPKKMSMIAEAL